MLPLTLHIPFSYRLRMPFAHLYVSDIQQSLTSIKQHFSPYLIENLIRPLFLERRVSIRFPIPLNSKGFFSALSYQASPIFRSSFSFSLSLFSISNSPSRSTSHPQSFCIRNANQPMHTNLPSYVHPVFAFHYPKTYS